MSGKDQRESDLPLGARLSTTLRSQTQLAGRITVRIGDCEETVDVPADAAGTAEIVAAATARVADRARTECRHSCAYDCAFCGARFCFSCDAPWSADPMANVMVKTAVRGCPEHRERVRMGR